MPINERHKQQKTKNITLLAVLLTFIGVLYAITLLKFGHPPA